MRNRGGLILILVVGAITFGVAVLFFGAAADTQGVVVATQPLAAGTRLEAHVLTVKEVHASAVLPGALASLDDAEGQLLNVSRAAGDQITADMVGAESTVGLAATLAPNHVALAVKVSQDTGVGGMLRRGATVRAIALLDTEDLAQIGREGLAVAVTSTVAAPAAGPSAEETEAKVYPGTIAREIPVDLRVIMVPQTFVYEETVANPDDQSPFAAVRSSSGARQASVVVLDVPVTPQLIWPDLPAVSPAELLAYFNDRGRLHLQVVSANANLPPTDGVRSDTLVRGMLPPGPTPASAATPAANVTQ